MPSIVKWQTLINRHLIVAYLLIESPLSSTKIQLNDLAKIISSSLYSPRCFSRANTHYSTQECYVVYSSQMLQYLITGLLIGVGIMAAGAVNAVRGSRSSVEELFYIYSHSDRFVLTLPKSTSLNQHFENKLLAVSGLCVQEISGFLTLYE